MIFLAASLLLAACAKEDFSKAGSLSQAVSSDAVIPELNTCKIRNIYQNSFNPGSGEPLVANGLFTYNSKGNPYSVTYSNEGTGVLNHYFLYDKQNRLIEYQESYVTFPVVRHIYKYQGTGTRIIKDSTIRINPGNGEINTIHVSTLEYDSQGRVIKETIVNTYSGPGWPVNPTRRPTYTYDSRGNLAVAGWKSSSYDYKINPLRQNAIFQFIFRNYSMNNAAVQPKYNSRGLPLSMKPSNDAFFNSSETIRVVYDCN
ncbi:MAG: hypothetical protein JNK79_16615 [Chitinophagaceae bacterium]|nr:hypothetical protein [Chitinophagaceae bacterium]